MPRWMRLRIRLLRPWWFVRYTCRRWARCRFESLCWPQWRKDRLEQRLADPSKPFRDYRLNVRIRQRLGLLP